MLIKVDGVYVAGIGLREASPEVPEAVYITDSVYGRIGINDTFAIEVKVLDRSTRDSGFARVSIRQLVELLRGSMKSR